MWKPVEFLNVAALLLFGLIVTNWTHKPSFKDEFDNIQWSVMF